MLLVNGYTGGVNSVYEAISFVLIPKNPVVNQSVTLRVSGVSGAILSFSWYGGLSDDDNMFLILTYNLSSYPVEKRGPLYIPGARGLPDGSLKISKLSTAYRGIFTVGIQAESFPTKGSIYLPVFEVTLLCSFRSDTARVFWSRLDGIIPSGVIYRANSRTMTIPRFSQSDAGQYQCEAENPISKNISEPYTLHYSHHHLWVHLGDCIHHLCNVPTVQKICDGNKQSGSNISLSVWMDGAHGIGVQLIPQYPVVNQSVTLRVTGVTGTIRQFTWYKGSSTDSNNQIFSVIPSANSVTKGPQYLPRASWFPNGSLQISGLVPTDQGNYTVQIQTENLTQVTVLLRVNGEYFCTATFL
uniref:Carcinoembryonic antigen-related cell adhesion molecule 19 like gene M n=1 Tax=Xenopus tropicalis TaxID=8364 RepID=L7N3I7_XENTR